MTSDVTIREARLSDANAIARLTKQLGYEVDPSGVADRLSRFLQRDDHAFLIAEQAGESIGWVHMVRWEIVETDAFVMIAGLVVDRDHRKQGIGRMLLQRAEAWAVQQGCSLVRLWSSSTRTAAHAFYEHVGYTNIKTQYSFLKSLDASAPLPRRAFVPDVNS